MILTSLSKFSDAGLLVLRVGIGAFLVLFGWHKLAGGVHAWKGLGESMALLHIHFLPAFWGFCCALTETLGGLLVVIGLLFRPACILLTFNFVVATMVVYHGKNGNFQEWSHPATYLILFFSLIFIGAGKYSFDRS